jgi:hypothetical protein
VTNVNLHLASALHVPSPFPLPNQFSPSAWHFGHKRLMVVKILPRSGGNQIEFSVSARKTIVFDQLLHRFQPNDG